MMIPPRNSKDKYDDFIIVSLENALTKYIYNYHKIIEEFAPDPVHDFRVSIRRYKALIYMLRALFDVAYLDELESLLKMQLKSFSKLRDTQVQILRLEKSVYRHPSLYTFLVFLRNKEQDYINKAKSLTRTLDSSDVEGLTAFTSMELKSLMTKNNVYIQNLLIPLANSLINVIDMINQVDKSNLNSIHSVRIAFKKFRYILEIQSEILSLTQDDFKTLKQFQDIMGLIQDNSVFTNNLQNFAKKQKIIPFDDYKRAFSSIERERIILTNKFLKLSKHFIAYWQNIIR